MDSGIIYYDSTIYQVLIGTCRLGSAFLLASSSHLRHLSFSSSYTSSLTDSPTTLYIIMSFVKHPLQRLSSPSWGVSALIHVGSRHTY